MNINIIKTIVWLFFDVVRCILVNFFNVLLNFIICEKATKFCETSTLLLSVCTVDKSKVEISQNIRTLKVCNSEWLFLRPMRDKQIVQCIFNLVKLLVSTKNFPQ